MNLFGFLPAILIAPSILYLYEPQELTWVFVVSCFACFTVAYGIGANDVANSFGTSVGSGAISMRFALLIASFMEFGGAVALGSAVAETIRGGIADTRCFIGDESELMLGMMSALVATAIWLLVASYMGLPVSTTHSTVGAIIGFTIASKGFNCVEWSWGKSGKGFAGIALSWIISPVIAGFLGAIIYLLVVIFILKAPEPERRGFQSVPVILSITVAIVVAMIFFKSPATQSVPDWVSWVVVASSTVFTFILGYFGGIPAMKKFITLREKWTQGKNGKDGYISVEAKEDAVALESEGDNLKSSEKHSARIEKEVAVDKIFVFFQVMTASFESFAHGANDTANAIGPFAAIWYLWTEGVPAEGKPTPIWILAAGGAGIVLGLATFGSRVMSTIGKDLTKINFMRGFSIELSSTLCVVLASRLGFPVSTTHCQVGAVVAVGAVHSFLHRTRYAPAVVEDLGVSWKLFANVGMSWLVTVPIAALVSSGIFGFLVHSLIARREPFPLPCNNTVNATQGF